MLAAPLIFHDINYKSLNKFMINKGLKEGTNTIRLTSMVALLLPTLTWALESPAPPPWT